MGSEKTQAMVNEAIDDLASALLVEVIEAAEEIADEHEDEAHTAMAKGDTQTASEKFAIALMYRNVQLENARGKELLKSLAVERLEVLLGGPHYEPDSLGWRLRESIIRINDSGS